MRVGRYSVICDVRGRRGVSDEGCCVFVLIVDFVFFVVLCCVWLRRRRMGCDGIIGDMFGNMSFDSFSDDECVVDKYEVDGMVVDEEGYECVGDFDVGVLVVVNFVCDEVGYEFYIGFLILVC